MIHLNQLKLIAGKISFEIENACVVNKVDGMSKPELRNAYGKTGGSLTFWFNELEPLIDAYFELRDAILDMDYVKTPAVALHVDKSEFRIGYEAHP